MQLVEFGKEILAIIPGRVSTEVDASLSFDTEATKDKVGGISGLQSNYAFMLLPGQRVDRIVQVFGNQQRSHFDQNCLHLGRYCTC
jgi:hypothetical protein